MQHAGGTMAIWLEVSSPGSGVRRNIASMPRWWSVLGAVLAVLFASASTALAGLGTMARPAVSTGTCSVPGALEGVDVSSEQGTIDWSQVAQAGKAFGYARVGDGASLDPSFQTNFTGMKSAGLKAGGYFFFEPAQDPTTQANTLTNALTQAGFASGDLSPMIDVELTGGQSAATVVASLQILVSDVQRALGAAPVIFKPAGP